MKLGIIKERKNPPDRRVVFSPEKLTELQEIFPETEVRVETSNIRIFPDKQYEQHNIPVVEDLSDCDVLLGVKEVPIEALIPEKKYFFFSHTIKKQPYNRDLLRAILDKKIQLYDHEVITDNTGHRLIGFGRYAGIVGAYNGFRALGLRDGTFNLEKVENLSDYKAVKRELEKVKLPKDYKIVLTGGGKVANGAKEILEHLNLKEVNLQDYLINTFDEPVFCQIEVLEYNKPKNKRKFGDKYDFYNNPENYESNFMRFAKISNMFIAGHFYGDGAPEFITAEEARDPEFKIDLIADISCDIAGPIASTIKPSTIAEPFYGYNPETEKEVAFDAPNAITVMAVDNLPCELPKNASEGFGEMFLDHVIPAFYNDDKDGILNRALMTFNGKLTPRYDYLQDFVDGKE